MIQPASSQYRPEDVTQLRARVEEVFTPSSPVTRRDLFAGRTVQLQQMLDLAGQPGRHAVVFGERASGKTSLATIAPEFHSGPLGMVRVTAGPGDTFESLWNQVAEGVRNALRRALRGVQPTTFPSGTPTALVENGATPEAVVAMLARLSASAPAWIVFDDFDRVADAATRTQMRAVAEATAEAAPNVTLVFVGCAATGDGVMAPSFSLVPVHVTRMTADESIEAVLRALRAIEMRAEDSVVERIATLANGLPQVTQGLAHAAASAASEAGVAIIGNAQLDAAVKAVIAHADATVADAYEQATVRARRGIYPEILLSCALAPRDEYGTFTVAGVCDTVTRIVRREVRGLTNQVSALTEDGRGAILHKQGAAKLARYRFVDPRLEPYILMRGLEDGWTTHAAPSWLPGVIETQELSKAA